MSLIVATEPERFSAGDMLICADAVGQVIQVQERRCPELDDIVVVWFPSGVPGGLFDFVHADDPDGVVAVDAGTLTAYVETVVAKVPRERGPCPCAACILARGVDVDTEPGSGTREKP